MVEIEQRRLCAFEEDRLPLAEGLVDDERGVGDIGAQPLRVRLRARGDVLEIECLDLVHALEPEVLLGKCDLDLLSQDLRVEKILDPDADAGGFVRICGTDPAAGRTDLQLAEPPLGRLVDRDVPRHDQVRVSGEVERPAVAVRVELSDEHFRIDDAAGTEDCRLPGEDPRRDLADLVRLAVEDDRMPCVRTALVAAYEVGFLGEQVDDLPLAFVAPLRSDDHGRRHGKEVCLSGWSVAHAA